MKTLLTCCVLCIALSTINCQAQSSDLYKIREVNDLAYYTGPDAHPEKHKLDLYLPEGVSNFPTMLWIHGGAWIVGDRKQEADFARRFAERGIGMAVISYRLSPGTWANPELTEGIQHPEHPRDASRALRWVIDHAEEYNIDVKKMVISGYSAGGHMSALMCTDETYLKEVNLNFKDVAGAVPIAGGYDIAAYYQTHLTANGKEMADSHVLGVFGPEETLPQVSPTTFLQKKSLPMLVISESQTYDYTKFFEDKVKEMGNKEVKFIHYMDRDHRSLYAKMKAEGEDEARTAIIDFIKKLTS